MQDANELSEAIQIFKKYKRGASWILIVADGQGEEQGGAVIEYSANYSQIRYTDYNWNPSCFQKFLGYTENNQNENNPNVVVAANHYITPEMNIRASALKSTLENSQNRYDAVLDQILNEEYGLYGNINLENGKNLVNYLHSDLSHYLEGYDDYHVLDYIWMPEVLEDDFVFSKELPIAGHRTIFDLGNLELKALYGTYNDPWVSYKMSPN